MAVEERNFRNQYYDKMGFRVVEEKKSADALEKECDTLIKKVKLCFSFLCCVSVIITCSFFFHSHLLKLFFFWLGSAGEIGEKQSEGSRGRLGVSQQGETAETERTGYGDSFQTAPGKQTKIVMKEFKVKHPVCDTIFKFNFRLSRSAQSTVSLPS